MATSSTTQTQPNGRLLADPLDEWIRNSRAGDGIAGDRYWEQSPEGIYFVARSRQPVLQLFHLKTGAITSIMKLTVPPSLAYRGLSISPNGRNFLYLHPDALLFL